MKVFVGTSGWYYSWNKDLNFDWFIKNSGLNSVELNASFYRFPFPNQVKSWANKGKQLRWSIKVNKLITHIFKFSQRAFETWRRFESLFKPLEKNIDFYLFQLPPSLIPTFSKKLEFFIEKTNLNERFALEFRNIDWFKKEWVDWASNLKITLVSVDCPDFPRDILNSNNIIYERMHGRYAWYSHYYSDEELEEVAEKIEKIKPDKVYIHFNNNHAMLENAQRMLKILSSF